MTKNQIRSDDRPIEQIPSRPTMTRDQVRQVDEIAIHQHQMRGIVLMENAGRGAASIIHQQSPKGKIIILCGVGNNGGDGYVIARHLDCFQRDVEIFSLADPDRLAGDAKENFQVAQKAEIPITVLENTKDLKAKLITHKIVIDAMLGTGATGPPRHLYAQVINLVNHDSAVKYAIDIPTGLDCDSGLASEPTLEADHTLTFVAEKVGFKKNNAEEFLGVVHVIDIGVPRKLLDHFLSS